ncbi:MAG: type III-A CRISPR-associated RAMP protein Csm3 [Planctomycetes bacterium]|nr:type III-A CRISPR-associated RAMP protein Csm3 [Planctomycetota bacterium]
MLKLKKYVRITGTLTCRSGIRIGGSKEDVEVGGMDNPVIRHPLTKLPYIPGSSLKGKLRSLLEYAEGKVTTEGSGEPCKCAQEDCLVCRVFGPHKAPKHSLGPSRIILRDAPLTDEWAEKLKPLLGQGLNYVEVKTENMIDRRTGVATNPRPVERVPSGAQFALNISVRVFEADEEKKILDFIERGLQMLQSDTLGGSGTRGYGWVKLDYKVGE